MFPPDPQFSLITERRDIGAIARAAELTLPLGSAGRMVGGGRNVGLDGWESRAADLANDRLQAVAAAGELIQRNVGEQQLILYKLASDLQGLADEQRASLGVLGGELTGLREEHGRLVQAAAGELANANAFRETHDRSSDARRAQATSDQLGLQATGVANRARELIGLKEREMESFEQRASELVRGALVALAAIIEPTGYNVQAQAFAGDGGRLSIGSITAALTAEPRGVGQASEQDRRLVAALLLLDPEAAGVLATIPGFEELVYDLAPEVAYAFGGAQVPTANGSIADDLASERLEAIERGAEAALLSTYLTTSETFDISPLTAHLQSGERSEQRSLAAERGQSYTEFLVGLQEEEHAARERDERIALAVNIGLAITVSGGTAAAVSLALRGGRLATVVASRVPAGTSQVVNLQQRAFVGLTTRFGNAPTAVVRHASMTTEYLNHGRNFIGITSAVLGGIGSDTARGVLGGSVAAAQELSAEANDRLAGTVTEQRRQEIAVQRYLGLPSDSPLPSDLHQVLTRDLQSELYQATITDDPRASLYRNELSRRGAL